jgi:integrase
MSEELQNTIESKKRVSNAQAGSLTHFFGKTDLRYWRERIFHPVYSKDAQKLESSNWAVEIQYRGRRHRWSLETANRETAAAKAKEIFLFVQANGWEAAIAKFRASEKRAKKSNVTIGEFLQEVQAKSGIHFKTLEGYTIALRKIVADIKGLPHGRGGNKKKRTEWRAKVDAVKLSEITREGVQKWKLDFLKRAGEDPVSQRTARISANSFLRRAKSLFSAKAIEHVAVELLDPVPFTGLELFPRQSMKYRSAFDVRKLVEKASEELAPEEPEQFKAFLLATMAGLRRNEIDKLLWDSVLLDHGKIRIEATKYYSAKSEDSLGDVEIDKELVEVLRGYRAKAKGPFVIESQVVPKFNVGWEHYRCTSIFEALIKWLKANGVPGAHPLHTLRKEFGSLIAQEHGIYAASKLLRHADIQTTANHYLDKKQRITAGLGELLAPGQSEDNKIVEISEGNEKDQQTVSRT